MFVVVVFFGGGGFGGGLGGGGFASLCVNENHEYSQGLPSSGTTYMFYAQIYV